MSSEDESQGAVGPPPPPQQSLRVAGSGGASTSSSRTPSRNSLNLNELESISLPDDPTENDIYTLNPSGSNFQALPSLVPGESPSSSSASNKNLGCVDVNGKPCGKPQCQYCVKVHSSLKSRENATLFDCQNGNSSDIELLEDGDSDNANGNFFSTSSDTDSNMTLEPPISPIASPVMKDDNFNVLDQSLDSESPSSEHQSYASDCSHDTSSSSDSFAILHVESPEGSVNGDEMPEPECFDSWVDLTNPSNPSTPPHPLQREQQLTAASQELVAASFPSSSSAGGVVSSDIPPALPHLTGIGSQSYASTSGTQQRPVPSTSSAAAGAVASSSGTQRNAGEDSDTVGPLLFSCSDETLRLLNEAQRESRDSSARVSLSSSRIDTPRDSPRSPPNSPNIIRAASQRGPDLEHYGGVCYINYYSQTEDNYVRVERHPDTDWIWDWSSRPDQRPPKEWRFSHPASTASSSSAASNNADPEDTATPPQSVAETAGTGVSLEEEVEELNLEVVHVEPAVEEPQQELDVEEPPQVEPAVEEPQQEPAVDELNQQTSNLNIAKRRVYSFFSKELFYAFLLTNVCSLFIGTGFGVWIMRKAGLPSSMITTLRIV